MSMALRSRRNRRRRSSPSRTPRARKRKRKVRGWPKSWCSFAVRFRQSRTNLRVARAELAALNERLSAAEALASRLAAGARRHRSPHDVAATAAERPSAKRRLGLSRRTSSLRCSSRRCAQKKRGWKNRRSTLEAEWDSGRKRVASMEDTLRFGRQSLQEIREQRGPRGNRARAQRFRSPAPARDMHVGSQHAARRSDCDGDGVHQRRRAGHRGNQLSRDEVAHRVDGRGQHDGAGRVQRDRAAFQRS